MRGNSTYLMIIAHTRRKFAHQVSGVVEPKLASSVKHPVRDVVAHVRGSPLDEQNRVVSHKEDGNLSSAICRTVVPTSRITRDRDMCPR